MDVLVITLGEFFTQIKCPAKVSLTSYHDKGRNLNQVKGKQGVYPKKISGGQHCFVWLLCQRRTNDWKRHRHFGWFKGANGLVSSWCTGELGSDFSWKKNWYGYLGCLKKLKIPALHRKRFNLCLSVHRENYWKPFSIALMKFATLRREWAMKISLLTLRLSMHSLENSYRTLGSAKKFSH